MVYALCTQPDLEEHRVKQLHSVGVREFRKHTAAYLKSAKPIAVRRYDRVVGLYFPLPPDEGELQRAFERLGTVLEQIRAQSGVTEEQLSDWFDLRKPVPE